MIIEDGLLGQMMEPVSFPELTAKSEKKDWAADGHGNEREHNIINSLYLQPDVLEKSVRDRFEKYAKIEETESDAEAYNCDDAEIVVCAFGATARVAKSAVKQAREKGIKAGLFRPKTLWPFPAKQLNDACKNAKALLCVEMSMGQMIDDIKLAINCSKPVEFFGRTGGIIPKPTEILDEIEKLGGAY